MGSLVAQLHSVNHPTDADALILTGFSKYIKDTAVGILTVAGAFPAPLANPKRFSALSPGYLTLSSPEGAQFEFYFGPDDGTYYQPGLPAYDYSKVGTLTVGEGASGVLEAATSTFKGGVLVISGQQDSVFCSPLGTTVGECVGATNYLSTTGSLYPRAEYSWYSVPDAGHCWQFHYSALEGFRISHQWLADQGF
jgi:pimeloyl-ACP methyl ester carboxylesterase